jgi:hypothetical protein
MREQLLEGVLEYPGTAIFQDYPNQENEIRAFWKAIWINYLAKQDTNGIYWYKLLGPKLYNDLMRRLSHNKWVCSLGLSGRRWASIKLNEDKLLDFVSPDELVKIKATKKYDKYLLECEESRAATLVKQNGKTKRTGLVRKGFRDAGNTQFGYDMDALAKYEEAVKLNLTKSMDKIRETYPNMQTDEASYDVVSVGIFDWHKANKYEVFTTGTNINDSRGRAISQGLTKIANPISSKDFRAALVITYEE